MSGFILQPGNLTLAYFSDDPEHPGEVFLNVTINGQHIKYKMTEGERNNALVTLAKAAALRSRD
jgi:hypothetical protein